MTQRWPLTTTGLALLALTGCTIGDASEQATPGPTVSSTSSPPAATSTTPPSPTSPTSTVPVDLTTYICTDGIAEPDRLVLKATNAARAGTRSTNDVAATFFQAQKLVQALAERSDEAALDLSPSLRQYADVLGQVRLSGEVELDAIPQTRGALSTSCTIATSPPS